MVLEKEEPQSKPPDYYSPLAQDWPWVWALKDRKILDWKPGLSEDEIYAQSVKQAQLPVAITDNVYLGDAQSIKDIDTLKALGITAVLNMAGPKATYVWPTNFVHTLSESGLSYLEIDAVDMPSYKLLQWHWAEASAFLEASTANGGKCVVHCVAGLNRSGLVVAAHYLLTKRTTVLETVKHIRRQRGNLALCNGGFLQQLVALARQNELLGAEPGTEASTIRQAPPQHDFWFELAMKEQTRKNGS